MQHTRRLVVQSGLVDYDGIPRGDGDEGIEHLVSLTYREFLVVNALVVAFWIGVGILVGKVLGI